MALAPCQGAWDTSPMETVARGLREEVINPRNLCPGRCSPLHCLRHPNTLAKSMRAASTPLSCMDPQRFPSTWMEVLKMWNRLTVQMWQCCVCTAALRHLDGTQHDPLNPHTLTHPPTYPHHPPTEPPSCQQRNLSPCSTCTGLEGATSPRGTGLGGAPAHIC